jgi:hypothetical protein
MAVDYVTLWGLTTATGLVFRPILEHLALKTAEDFAKDFIKGCFKSVLKGPEKEAVTIAAGLAVKSFLQVVQDELEGAGMMEEGLRALVEPLELFLKDPEVHSILGPALTSHSTRLDAADFSKVWDDLNMPTLPLDFSWSRVLKRYQKSVTAIRRDTPGLQAILNTELLESIAAGVGAAAPIAPDADLIRYQKAMQRAYGYLKLETLDATTYDLQRLRLDRLFVPQSVRECNEFFPQLFELPKDVQKNLKLLDYIEEKEYEQREIERYRKAYLRRSPKSVLKLFLDSKYRLLAFLGDPGSGKSSLLQWEVLKWADQPTATPVPILIELAEYGRNRLEGTVNDFLEYLHKGTGLPCRLDQHVIKEKLEAGKASFLLDGLDEVFDPDLRREVVKDIARFANDFQRARFVLTSRVIGYKAQTLRDAGFNHFMLQDLNPVQVEDLLSRWHHAAYPNAEEGDAKKRRLQTALRESRAITELAGNPLLLTMMAILNRTQDLPRDRAELYNQCSRLLLYQWKADQALRSDERLKGLSLDFKDKQAMLRRVAREMQNSEPGLAGNIIEEQRLEDTLAAVVEAIGFQSPRAVARAVIDHLRRRNFILCFVGGAHYSFVHRTFLEYFCAADFLWQFKEERSLDVEGLKTAAFAPHFSDEKWHEVLCLICGMLVPRIAADIITFLLQHAGAGGDDSVALLAARCYGEIRNKAEVAEVRVAILEPLKSLVAKPEPSKDEIHTLLNVSADAVEPTQYRALFARAKSETAGRIRQRRIQALRILGTEWQGDASVAHWLFELSRTRHDPVLREAVFQQLTDSWGDLPETFHFFTQLTLYGDKSLLRLAALSHLLRRWDNDEVVQRVITIAQTDSDHSVRLRAIQALPGLLKDRETLQHIIQQILANELREYDYPTPIRKVCFEILTGFSGLDDKTYELAKLGARSRSGLKIKRLVMQLLLRRADNPELPSLFLEMAPLANGRKLRGLIERTLKERWPSLLEVAAQGEQSSQEANPAKTIQKTS